MAKQLNVNLAFTADTSSAKMQLQDLQHQLTKLTQMPQSKLQVTGDIQEAIKASIELKTHLQSAVNVRTGNLDFTKLNQSIANSGKTLNQYAAQLRSLGPAGQQAFMSLAQSVASAEIPIRRSNAALQGMWTTLKNTARWQLSSSILHGFMGAVQSAYGYAQDLNESLNNIRIVTGQNTDQMSKFANEANRAAKELSTTTNSYAKASLIYYQQGLSDQQVKERTDITVKMANVARTSAETVSDQMTAVWNNFYNGSKSLEYYADVMTALGAATATSTDEISEGLNKFAAVAETVGLSYEYAASALATITSNTRESADVVGNALKTLFARIQGLQLGETLEDGVDLNKYSEALDKVGIKILDSNGELKAMDIILTELADKWNTIGEAEQIALAQTVAGVRQYTHLISLMKYWDNGDSDSMMANLNTSKGAEGTLQKQADIYAESWEAASKRVRAAAEGVYNDILDDEAFIDILNVIEDIIKGFDILIDSVGGLGGALTTVGAILTRVFSAQISRSLTDMAYNLKMMTAAGRQQAQDEKINFMNAAAESIPQNTDYTTPVEQAQMSNMKDQLKLQSMLIANSERMTATELATNQALMDRTRTMQTLYEQAAQNKMNADAEVSDIKSDITSDIAADTVDNPDIFKSRSADVKMYMDDIRHLATLEDEMGERGAEALRKISAGGDEAQNALIELQAEVYEMGNADEQLGDIANEFIEATAEGENLEEALQDLIAKIAALRKLSVEEFKGLGVTDPKKVDALNAAIERQVKTTRQATNAEKEAVNARKATEKSILNATGAQKTWADNMVNAASVAMSTVSVIRTLQGTISTLKDPDTTGWEKFVAILSGFSMVVMSATSGFKGLAKIAESMLVSENALTSAIFGRIVAQEASIATMSKEEVAKKLGITTDAASILISKAKAKAKLEEMAASGVNIAAMTAEQLAEKVGISVDTAKLIITKLKTGATLAEAMAEAGLTGAKSGSIIATIAQTAANWGLLASMSPIAAIVLILTVAIVALVAIVWGLVKAFEAIKAASPEGKLKAAQQNAEELATALEDAKTAADDLSSAFDAYESVVETLDSCTQGTDEWNKALQDVNGTVMELMASYPQLATMMNDAGERAVVKDAETGQWKIQDWAIEQLQQEASDRVTKLQYASMSAQQEVRAAQVAVNTNRIESELSGGPAAYRQTTTADGDLYQMDVTGEAQDLIRENLDKFNEASSYEDVNKIISELFADANITSGAEAWAERIYEILPTIQTLTDAIESNTLATQMENEMIVSDALADNVDVQSSENKEAILKIVGSQYDDIYKTEKDKLGTFGHSGNAQDNWNEFIQKAGLENSGYSFVKAEGKGASRLYTYKDGDETKSYTAEQMQSLMATTAALNALGDAAQNAINALNNIKSENIGDISDFIANGNFESSSEAEINDMRQTYLAEDGTANRDKIIEDFGGEENLAQIAEALAPEDLGDYANATDWFIDNFVNKLNAIDFDDVGAHLVNSVKTAFDEAKANNTNAFSQLDVGQQEDIATLFDSIFAQAGKSGLAAVQEIFSDQDLDSTELEKITEILSNTDWNSASVESLTTAFTEGGIAAGDMQGPLGVLIQLMKEAAGISGLEANVESYKKYQSIKESVEQGEGIDDDLYASLPEDIKTFFDYTAEGLWALTGDAEAFYKLIESESTKGFVEDNKKLQTENDQINSYLNNPLNSYETLSDYQGSTNTENNQWAASNLLDYLTLTGGMGDSEAQEYQAKIDDGTITQADVQALVEVLRNNGDQTAALAQKLEANNAEIEKNESAIASSASDSTELAELLQSGQISKETANDWKERAVDKEIETQGFEEEDIDALADAFEKASGESGQFSEDLKDNEAGLKEVAKEAKRYDRAVEALTDGYKEWSKALKSGDVGKQAKAMKELSQVYGDMLDIDADEIPESFLASAENLDLMKKAAEGSQDAFDQLQANVSFDRIKEKVGELPGWTKEKLEEIASHKIQAGELIDFGEGATGLGAQLTDLYTDAANAARQGGATVAEALAFANQVMADEGFNAPEIEMEEKTVTVTGKLPSGWTPQENGTVTTVDANGNPQTVKGVKIVAQEGDTYTYEQTMLVPKGKGKIGKSAERIGGGGGAKKSGGGGGGGSKKKDEKKASDEIERYHEIKEVISDLERQYDRINKARTRAFGMDAVDLMDQEIAKTEELITAQKKYLSEIQANQKKDKSALAAYGATFDAEGRITNYDEIMSQQLAKFNAARTEEAEEAYEEFKKILEQYEETQNLLEEQEASLEDLENRLYDQKLEKVDIEVQLKLSLADDSLKYIEFLMGQLEDDAYDVAEAFALLGQEAANYRDQINTANEGISDILANHGIDLNETSIEDIVKNGQQLGLTAEEIDKIREYRDTAMSAAQALAELKQIAVDKVTGAFDAWNEKFTTQIEILEHYSSVMESFANIVDIVGKETLGITDEMMSKWTQSSVDNSINTLASQRKRLDALRAEEQNLRAQLAAAATEEEKDMIQKALDHIIAETNSAEEEMMAQWEATLEAAAQAFEQAVDTSINAFEKAISGTYGSLDALQTAFDQASEIADRYVDDYKEIYELSKLNRDITNSIDNTDNVKAKKALRDLQKEIVELQESDVQMSEYDLEHLRAKYELRLAEIALEEAQNAKSQVRMRKDSEGNYSYVFTADASAVEKAQQDYETKLYEMQELNSEYIKEMQNNILQSEIELANALRELDRAKFKSDEEYYAEVNRLTQYYTGQRNYYLDEMNKGITNNQETVNEDWKRYSDATGYKMSADKDYLDNFDETIYAQLTGYRSIEDAQNQFADATKVMVEDLRSAFKKWQDNTEEAMKAAGTSIADFGKTVNETVYGEDGEGGISKASDDIVNQMDLIAEGMAEAFGPDAMAAFKEFAEDYVEWMQPMIDATSELVGDINDLITLEADLNKKEQEKEDEEDEDEEDEDEETTGTTVTNPYGKPSSLNGNYQNYTERSGVKAIQHALKEMGYDIGSYGIDGKYGSATAAAVKAFQKASGITADGIVGPDTKAKFKAKGYLTGGRVDSTGWAWLDGTPDRPEYVLNADQTDAFIRLVDDLHYMNELKKLADIQEKGMYMIDNTAKELMDSLSFIDDVMRIIELNAGMQSIGLGTLSTSNSAMGVEPAIQQEITIHAEFPDATDHNEIEAAFDSLFVRASQFANRKN